MSDEPTAEETEATRQGLLELVRQGLLELVDDTPGAEVFRMTPKGTSYVEELIAPEPTP